MVNYVNIRLNVKIICPIHGLFKRSLQDHYLSEHGCSFCGKEASFKTRFTTVNECKYCKKELLEQDRYKANTNNTKQKYRFHKECKYFHNKEKQLIKDFGITLDKYKLMYNEQKGKCDICKNNLELFNSKTHVDHCHNTGKVRGLLCSVCNLLLGYSLDDIDILNSAINYLNKNS